MKFKEQIENDLYRIEHLDSKVYFNDIATNKFGNYVIQRIFQKSTAV